MITDFLAKKKPYLFWGYVAYVNIITSEYETSLEVCLIMNYWKLTSRVIIISNNLKLNLIVMVCYTAIFKNECYWEFVWPSHKCGSSFEPNKHNL